MTVLDAINSRHSVRSYSDKAISDDAIAALQGEIHRCNDEGGLHIQLVTDEATAFDSMMAHYGRFSGVRNYIALVGKKSPILNEKLGYYGERIALKAQLLGLNTCWVAISFSKAVTKKHICLGKDEKLVCVLSLGYGATQGVPHNSRSMEALCRTQGNPPDWFLAGVNAAMLAPTAVNQQKFCLVLTGDNTVKAEDTGGFYSDVDLGIVKYHFEAGAGTENFCWSV